MAPTSDTPVILLVFANSRYGDSSGYLRNLPRERRAIEDVLMRRARDGVCRIESEQNTTLSRLFDLLDAWGDRIVGLHFGGHADPEGLMFEDDAGRPVTGLSAGIAERLARLPRLRWVFLNGCGTAAHVATLHGPLKVPVIVTETAIRDDVAVDVARRFYFGLSHGQSIRRAFDNAQSAVRTACRLPEEVLRPDRAEDLRLLRPVEEAAAWPWRLALPVDRPEAAAQGLLDPRKTLGLLVPDDSAPSHTVDAWPPGAGPDPTARPDTPDTVEEIPAVLDGSDTFETVALEDTAPLAIGQESPPPMIPALPSSEHAVILPDARVRHVPSVDIFDTDDRPTLKRNEHNDAFGVRSRPPQRRRSRPATSRLPATLRGRSNDGRPVDPPAPARPAARHRIFIGILLAALALLGAGWVTWGRILGG